MALGVLVVESNARDSEHEAELNCWYVEQHIPDMLRVKGFVSARRFRHVGGDPARPSSTRYLAIYEVEADDLAEVMEALRSAQEAGLVPSTDAFDREPPPRSRLFEAL